MTRFYLLALPRRLASVTFITLLVAAAPANAPAALVTFDFSGEVTELVDPNGLGLFGFPASVGDLFSGHFSYELGPGNQDQLPADAEVGAYDLIDFAVDGAVVSFSNLILGVEHTAPVPSPVPAPPIPGFDRISILALTPAYPSRVRLVLQAPYGAIFSDDSLPSDLLLSDFTEQRTVTGIFSFGVFPQPNIQDLGQIRSLSRRATVPGPTTLALIGIGLTGLGFSRRKRR
jgi:hypothetical protein